MHFRLQTCRRITSPFHFAIYIRASNRETDRRIRIIKSTIHRARCPSDHWCNVWAAAQYTLSDKVSTIVYTKGYTSPPHIQNPFRIFVVIYTSQCANCAQMKFQLSQTIARAIVFRHRTILSKHRHHIPKGSLLVCVYVLCASRRKHIIYAQSALLYYI